MRRKQIKQKGRKAMNPLKVIYRWNMPKNTLSSVSERISPDSRISSCN